MKGLRAIIAGTLCLATFGGAHGGAIESSYRAAREVIENSIATMELEWWMSNPTPVLIQSSGTLFMGAEHQGKSPDDPTPSDFLETWAYEPASGRVGREYKQLRPDGTSEWMKEIFEADGTRWYVDMASEQAFEEPAEVAADARGANLRRFPALLLKEALSSPESLRGIGRYGPFDGVQARTGGHTSLSLFFGRESHMLGWVEYLADLPSFSDSEVSWRFSDYRKVWGLGMVPHQYRVHINNEVYMDMRVNSVKGDANSVRNFLALPAKQNTAPETDAPAPPPWQNAEVTSAGDGVWLVRNLRTGFHMMFVEFENYLLAVDAPSGYPLLQELPAGDVISGYGESSLTAVALKMMRKAVPGKPIRYSVMTHFHSDHAGGVFAYQDRGTTLLIHESEADAFDGLLNGTHTLCPDSREGMIDVREIDDRHVINDGDQRVEILDVGENPHSDHMLVLWLPKQKIMFVADLLTGWEDRPVESHSRLNQFFMDWLEQHHLKPEIIYTSHGGGRVIMPSQESA